MAPSARTTVSQAAALLQGGLRPLDAATRFGVIASMGVLVVLLSVQVFARYALNASLDFAPELSRLCFVWAVFLAIPHGIQRGVHVSITLLTGALPPRVREALLRAIAALGAALMGLVAREAAVAAADNWDQLMPTVELSVGVFYLALVVCGVHSAMHLLHQCLTGRPGSIPETGEGR